MTEKNSFVLYKDYLDVFEMMDNEEFGQMMFAVYRYEVYGEEPTDLPDKAMIAFKMVKKNLVRDEAKYEKVCERNKKNGVKGGRPKDKNKTQETQWVISKPKKPDSDSESDSDSNSESVSESKSDSVSDTDSVSVSDSELSARRSRKSEAFGDIEKVKSILSYLNEKTDSEFSAESEATQRHINARLREGFKEEDFITVIDKKVDEWKGTDYEKYLRPSTLFGSKFEDYLYQKKTVKRDYYVAPGEDIMLPF